MIHDWVEQLTFSLFDKPAGVYLFSVYVGLTGILIGLLARKLGRRFRLLAVSLHALIAMVLVASCLIEIQKTEDNASRLAIFMVVYVLGTGVVVFAATSEAAQAKHGKPTHPCPPPPPDGA